MKQTTHIWLLTFNEYADTSYHYYHAKSSAEAFAQKYKKEARANGTPNNQISFEIKRVDIDRSPQGLAVLMNNFVAFHCLNEH